MAIILKRKILKIVKHKKIIDEDFKLVIENEINSITDLELVILKGHILIEYSLNKFIDDISEKTFDIYKESFQFVHKVKICKALGLFKSTKHSLEEIILTFNKVRNSIAHYLEYDENELHKLISLFKHMSKDVKPISNELTDIQITKDLVSSICGLIIGIKMGKQQIERFTTHILSNEMKKDEDAFKKRLLRF